MSLLSKCERNAESKKGERGKERYSHQHCKACPHEMIIINGDFRKSATVLRQLEIWLKIKEKETNM